MSGGNNLLINISSDNEFKYLLLEKRQPITRFSLGPAGSWLGFAQPVLFYICGMAAWESPRSSVHDMLVFQSDCYVLSSYVSSTDS